MLHKLHLSLDAYTSNELLEHALWTRSAALGYTETSSIGGGHAHERIHLRADCLPQLPLIKCVKPLPNWKYFRQVLYGYK